MNGLTFLVRYVEVTMMTSSNGAFSALLVLCVGNSPVTGAFPTRKASDAELWCFLRSWTNGSANNRDAGDLRRHRAHYDVNVNVMQYSVCHIKYQHGFCCALIVVIISLALCNWYHGPLTRYVKLRAAHAPGMPGTFFPPPTSKKTAG